MATVTKRVIFKRCEACQSNLGEDNFLKTKNIFYNSGRIPICNSCLVSLVDEEVKKRQGDEWNCIDKICQLLDIPFEPKRWVGMYLEQGARAIIPYATMYLSAPYEQMDWKEQQKIYEELEDSGTLTETISPQIKEKQLLQLKERWGSNYCEEDLYYLERLYDGILQTQNINGDLQHDQARKLCKISLQIEERIRAGEDFDKLLSSYEKLVKVGDFTAQNVKNGNDFDSVGEIFAYLEKTGYECKYYDGVPKDIVDKSIEDIQKFSRRLYVNETGIGEEISRRIEGLKLAAELEGNDETDRLLAGLDIEETYDDDDYEREEFEPIEVK